MDQDAAFWEYSEDLRTYWFAEPYSEGAEVQYRACGVLMGQAILTDTFIAPVFPEAIYTLLLQALDSPHAPPWSLRQLATVSPHMASGLEKLCEYEGEDVADVFPLEWPREAELAGLAQDARPAYVNAYVHWFFTERYAPQARPFCQGFQAVVGHSRLIRSLVDAPQLEQIICGIEEPMDIAGVRQAAKVNGWAEEDAAYLATFWGVVADLNQDETNRFALFVSASTRMPLKGWSNFHMQIQKNGTGDDRLPTAYTCFRLLLLPRYSTTEVLKSRLLQAIYETQGFGLS